MHAAPTLGTNPFVTELSAQSSVGLDLDQDPLVLVSVPPGLDLVPGDDDTN